MNKQVQADGASRSVTSRAFGVLEVFTPRRPHLTLAEITRRAQVPHATAHRLVTELTSWGALERDDFGRYTIGLRLWELGMLSPRALPFRTAALPFMEDLYEATHQHVQLAVLDGTEAVVVERMSARHAVDIVSQIGGRLPLHCSAVGKVLLAHAGLQLFEDVVSIGLERYTDETIVTSRRLRANLDECRRTGVATVRDERSIGVHSVATKIVGRYGHVVGALSVVISAQSMTLGSVSPAVIAAGLGISQSLGAH